MDRLKFLVVALFIGSALSLGQAASQTPTRPPNMMDTLNQEAGAGDADGGFTHTAST